MDLSKFKTAIGTIAPWLAGTLGTPVMGVAVQALENVFGMQPGTATPQNLMTALAGATPQQLQDLRTADQKHSEFMASIGYKDLETLAAIDAGDRDSARKMQIAVHSRWPGILSAVTTLAVIGAIAARMTGLALPQDTVTVQLIGSLTTGWGMCISYWFGTTRGSADKNNLLAQSTPS
jgi:hypothetical protein